MTGTRDGMAPRGRSPAERRQAALDRRARRAAVTDADVVMEAAAAFLAVRPRSVMETRRRLQALGYGPAMVEDVIERLRTVGYLDDRAFAQAWVESRDRSRPRGSHALRRELQLKGVDREVVDEVLAARAEAGVADPAGPFAASPSAERDAGQRLLQRQASRLEREPDPRRRRQKAYALLARHGFAPDVCADLAAALAEEPIAGADEGV
jgi:regulatory protein